jgi:hypothetical protein
MSKIFDWIKAGSLLTGSVVAMTKAVIQYNEFKREQTTLEHTRALQRRAWDKVINGELASARIGDMTIRSARATKDASPDASASPDPSASPVTSSTSTPTASAQPITATAAPADASAPPTDPTA